jgi:hypothetical protein
MDVRTTILGIGLLAAMFAGISAIQARRHGATRSAEKAKKKELMFKNQPSLEAAQNAFWRERIVTFAIAAVGMLLFYLFLE